MKDFISINGTEVTTDRLSWKVTEEYSNAITTAKLTISQKVATAPGEGDTIIIKRGLVTGEEDYIFRGIVMKKQDVGGHFILTCNNRLQECIKKKLTKAFEQEIDTEAGEISEIFKTLVNDYTPLSADDTTVTATGTAADKVLYKYIIRAETIWSKMTQLANAVNYYIWYDPDTNKVHFKPKGTVTYATTLNVGAEVTNYPKWQYSLIGMVNKVNVHGAVVYDTKEEEFSGDDSEKEFGLQYTPEDTEVKVGGTLQVRGQKDGETEDYIIDVEQKKLIFTVAPGTAVDNIYIRYGAQVPQTITLVNQTSIDTYGGEDSTASDGDYYYDDIKSFDDGEKRGRDILLRFGTPFVSTTLNLSSTIDDLQVGMFIDVIDTNRSENRTLTVTKITRSFPFNGDEIVAGDKPWRTEDWQINIEDRIHDILKHLNQNEDFIRYIYEFSESQSLRRRYFKFQKRNITTGFILGHPDFAILGTTELGWDGAEPTYTTSAVIQGGGVYREYFYDEDFKE